MFSRSQLFRSLVVVASLFVSQLSAENFFLTIGGGHSPIGNQVSIEKNVLLFQRTLRDLQMDESSSHVYFADGDNRQRDVKVIDPKAIPKANRLMAEFFGDQESLGLAYRNHQISDAKGASNPKNIRKWFREVGSTMKSGDRLVVYVTAHGGPGEDDEYDTTILMWENKSLNMTQFVGLLDGLPNGVEVLTVMVQCHAGGFSRIIFNDGDPKKGLSPQRRIGFFATVHDKPAAGCTAEAEEENYVEYSSYFWPALTGIDRVGKPISKPDYNHDGVVTFDEAHAYVMITADTIDIPVSSSDAFLTEYGRYGTAGSNYLTDDTSYDQILKYANASQRAVLEGLSEQLELTGDNRVSVAARNSETRRGRGRSRRRPRNEKQRFKERITQHLKGRWPELANVLNPVSISFVTDRADEFIKAVESHSDYARYRELADQPTTAYADTKKTAKYQRFVRTADNIIFAENLKRRESQEKYEQYRQIVQAESGAFAATTKDKVARH